MCNGYAYGNRRHTRGSAAAVSKKERARGNMALLNPITLWTSTDVMEGGSEGQGPLTRRGVARPMSPQPQADAESPVEGRSDGWP